MEIPKIINELKKHGSKKNLEGMARYGINPLNGFGVPIPVIRKLAKKIGKNHNLALGLWETQIHDARMLACFIDEPKLVTKSQMNKWVSELYSWDICDCLCGSILIYHTSALQKVNEWTKSKKEFVKRAGFVMMAWMAVHRKDFDDEVFESFFPIIKREATDERNFVKKAVNWALRQIGKRNIALNKKSIKLAKEILQLDSKATKWIAKDALKELTNPDTMIRNK